jgi:hypothetical protein
MLSKDAPSVFRTHSNYLRAFATLAYSGAGQRHSAYSSIIDRIINSIILSGSRITGVDSRQIRSSLENAWGTELLLALGERIVRNEEVVRLSNNWNVVQAPAVQVTSA